MSHADNGGESELILAAEDCAPEDFDSLHRFTSRNDLRVLLALEAHGPVLLRGGRGTGKSAFMIAASRRLDPLVPTSSAVGVYMSLRHAPLLKSTGDTYGRLLCEIIIRSVKDTLGMRSQGFQPDLNVGDVQYALSKLANKLGKRIVLFFDDAAHLGREASLEEFFDIYRTLSGSSVSCKAAIYPGVTRFGTRFDVYNDATVVDLLRSEELPGFNETFSAVMNARFPHDFETSGSRSLPKSMVAGFLAQAVLGNMRGFIFASKALKDHCGDGSVGVSELNEALISLAANYYWPLLDEIRPKLGKYEAMIPFAQEIASHVFLEVGQKSRNPRDIIVHRELDERLSKALQILEYAGFITKREASRALKSGGRGARYALNLCTLLEQTPGARLTRELLERWTASPREEAVQFQRTSQLATLPLPTLPDSADLGIFGQSIEILRISKVYPYGLTDHKINILMNANVRTVGDLAEMTDAQLDALPMVGSAHVARIRNVLGQAIWM